MYICVLMCSYIMHIKCSDVVFLFDLFCMYTAFKFVFFIHIIMYYNVQVLINWDKYGNYELEGDADGKAMKGKCCLCFIAIVLLFYCNHYCNFMLLL